MRRGLMGIRRSGSRAERRPASRNDEGPPMGDPVVNHRGIGGLLERARRFERPTLTLARLCSTPELRPLRGRDLAFAARRRKPHSTGGAQSFQILGIRRCGLVAFRQDGSIIGSKGHCDRPIGTEIAVIPVAVSGGSQAPDMKKGDRSAACFHWSGRGDSNARP